MKKITNIVAVLFYTILIVSCKTDNQKQVVIADENFSIEYQKYELENGLNVVLHQDKSDPIVSVAIQYGVGSNREKKGRTGFAHLFEHMLFQESENVPQDQFFKKIQDAGGMLNGGTWQDGTIYYEVVPNNALEMVMWLEADRMGYFINTLTSSAFANQQEVVQNEKRQRVDNNPYGHTDWVIDKNLYPDGHPYSWQVIGELEDLQNATVADVKEFYDKFYGPNNATLVVAGDFDEVKTKAYIQKYFGEIKRRKEVAPMKVQTVSLQETKRLYHEDNFATAPQLNMVWPAAEKYNKDAYALNFLGEILSDGKNAPLYKILVEQEELTSQAYAYNSADQIAGKFQISVTANGGVDLDKVELAIMKSFVLFEKEGVTEGDVERIKAGMEIDFYNGISSVLGKSIQLAQYDVFRGNPGYFDTDIANIKAVTKEDIMRVYEKYLKDKPYVLTSFVPRGEVDLIAENSEKAQVVEEKIVENIQPKVVEAKPEKVVKTPSSFDRSVQPLLGKSPKLNIPQSWKVQFQNGLQVHGIEQDELPLVNFSLVIEGGHLLDDLSKNGVANLMSDVLMEGTATKTPAELEEAIDLLGANITMYTTDESIVIRGNTLKRNLKETMGLVEEILLRPRWDKQEFERIKVSTINGIKRAASDPGLIAQQVYDKVLYGDTHPFAYPISGTIESVEAIDLQDLQDFYNRNFSPTISKFHFVGDLTQDEALAAVEGLQKWNSKEVSIPQYEIPERPQTTSLYFVDVPNAKQSVINIGYIALPRTSEDFFPVEVMNYKLGGSFSGNLNLTLREEKGYTYGAKSGFSGTKIPGAFTASASVRTNSTGESVEIFRDKIANYKKGITEEELQFTKNAMIKSNALRLETQGSLLGMLHDISAYGLEPDYIKKEEKIIEEMTTEVHKKLAEKYLDESKMTYLVVGDAATQFHQFKKMGFDEVKLLNTEGEEVETIKIKL